MLSIQLHNKKLFDELRALDLPSDQYVVFGSGPMGIRNLRRIRDVDIFVTKELWRKLLKTHESKDGNSIQLSPNIEALRTWSPGEWNVEELIAKADILRGIRFATIEDVYKWKQLRGSAKDEEDLKILETHLTS